ncbi:hypothetical protein CEUSTIGMA_g5915.t1 [Chlamydomonas eustigma]|uniref:ABC transporter domain-containing protein n=1 Tax=Chlamydomonas eustigma TaxID=1157962 RepID=A0A250X606_9CHLO|nr:hypothetical protein CEUSTIGMA_g5915.t1 [Chlamydomonas eustigma]|eukprot:GAX78476.1 hypothetical protein CEUSTIGMA_g5915.t1 [Chlamydomonas eustigma]
MQQVSSFHAANEISNPEHVVTSESALETDILIEFQNVYKSFGDKPILQGASFKIRRGEAVGIIGASGTGKSTTLRIAAGLLAPDSGNVLILGKPRKGLLSDSPDAEHLRVGMVFQNAALFDSLTVGENVGFLLYEHSNLPAIEIKRLVANGLSKVGLSGVENLYPAELSGGMKKRVALARAVVSDDSDDSERVLMYDEPTAGLDPVASTVVEDLMRSLHSDSMAAASMSMQTDEEDDTSEALASISGADAHAENGGHAIHARHGSNGAYIPHHHVGRMSGISSYIVVTHQHSTIRRAVDRIIFLHKGKVVWEGSIADFDTTEEPIVRQFAEGSLKGPISYV